MLGLGPLSFSRACSVPRPSIHGPKAESLNLKGVHENALVIVTQDYRYFSKWISLRFWGAFHNPVGNRREIK